jgi:hypothetical protein
MRILFDQSTPLPLKQLLLNHTVETVFELGWSNVENGALLALAEDSFDLFITTDQQLRYQQNLAARKLGVLVLMTTSWPRIRVQAQRVVEAVEQMTRGEYREISF